MSLPSPAPASCKGAPSSAAATASKLRKSNKHQPKQRKNSLRRLMRSCSNTPFRAGCILTIGSTKCAEATRTPKEKNRMSVPIKLPHSFFICFCYLFFLKFFVVSPIELVHRYPLELHVLEGSVGDLGCEYQALDRYFIFQKSNFLWPHASDVSDVVVVVVWRALRCCRQLTRALVCGRRSPCTMPFVSVPALPRSASRAVSNALM
jgi:hypothetical protein